MRTKAVGHREVFNAKVGDKSRSDLVQSHQHAPNHGHGLGITETSEFEETGYKSRKGVSESDRERVGQEAHPFVGRKVRSDFSVERADDRTNRESTGSLQGSNVSIVEGADLFLGFFKKVLGFESWD